MTQIGNVLAAYDSGRISLRALRTYFAALAAVAAREAAKRSEKGRHRQSAACSYQASELARLCACPQASIRRELKSLERAGLLLFSETELLLTTQPLPAANSIIAELSGGRSPLRPVPLPRTAVRFIARCNKVTTIKTMLAYCVRGLSLGRDGVMKGKGTAKASWIAQTCGLSLRAVRGARAELISAGFITPDTGSKQWKLNRDGAYFTVCITFGTQQSVAEDRVCPRLESAPLRSKKCMEFAPPYKDKKTPSGFKNQKTRNANDSGFCGTGRKAPMLSNIQPEDLKSVSRMLALHTQAADAGLAKKGCAAQLAFLAAAIHANRIAAKNAPGLFATIMRKGLWHFVTLEDEERARSSLQRWQSKTGYRTTDSPAERKECSNATATAPKIRWQKLGSTPLLAGIIAQLPVSTHSAGQYELSARTPEMYFEGSTRYDEKQQQGSDTLLAAVNLR